MVSHNLLRCLWSRYLLHRHFLGLLSLELLDSGLINDRLSCWSISLLDYLLSLLLCKLRLAG
jgi:hypothetical protein